MDTDAADGCAAAAAGCGGGAARGASSGASSMQLSQQATASEAGTPRAAGEEGESVGTPRSGAGAGGAFAAGIGGFAVGAAPGQRRSIVQRTKAALQLWKALRVRQQGGRAGVGWATLAALRLGCRRACFRPLARPQACLPARATDPACRIPHAPTYGRRPPRTRLLR